MAKTPRRSSKKTKRTPKGKAKAKETGTRCSACDETDEAAFFLRALKAKPADLLCKACFVCVCKKCGEKESEGVVFLERGFSHVTCLSCLGGSAVCRQCGKADSDDGSFSRRQRLKGPKAICGACAKDVDAPTQHAEGDALVCNTCGDAGVKMFSKKEAQKAQRGGQPSCKPCTVVLRQLAVAKAKLKAHQAVVDKIAASLDQRRADVTAANATPQSKRRRTS